MIFFYPKLISASFAISPSIRVWIKGRSEHNKITKKSILQME